MGVAAYVLWEEMSCAHGMKVFKSIMNTLEQIKWHKLSKTKVTTTNLTQKASKRELGHLIPDGFSIFEHCHLNSTTGYSMPNKNFKTAASHLRGQGVPLKHQNYQKWVLKYFKMLRSQTMLRKWEQRLKITVDAIENHKRIQLGMYPNTNPAITNEKHLNNQTTYETTYSKPQTFHHHKGSLDPVGLAMTQHEVSSI